MKTRFCLIILSLIILLPWTACSNGGDPSTPSDLTPDIGLEAPEITPPRDSADGPDVPDGAEVEIELDPSGEPTSGQFTFAGTPMAGLEVRINGELADLTDDEGIFEIPSIRDGAHTISFGMFGEVFHSQPYSPVSRFAQDSPEPGPGVMTGEVTDEDGPVAGALIIVLKGNNYAFAFTGQYGQYNLTGAPEGNCLAACVAEFHEPVFAAVNIPGDGTPLEKDFYADKNLSLGRVYGRVVRIFMRIRTCRLDECMDALCRRESDRCHSRMFSTKRRECSGRIYRTSSEYSSSRQFRSAMES
jgi:hypothetical protein